MELVLEQINKEEQELNRLNEQLQNRSQKFGSQFVPLTLTDYKLFKIRKARETGNIGYLDNILLSEIQDLQQRKDKIKKRIQQFYPELKVQSGDKHFAEKVVPDFTEQSLQIRENTWYLFGVDYMSNEMIRNYFHVNPHFKIEWINDSACNISFNSKIEAEEAIQPHLVGVGMKDQADIWYQLIEYEVEGVKRKLYARLATNKDTKKQDSHGHKSQYYQWVINKQKLGNYVKRKAHQQIIKTKGINRRDDYHKSNRDQVKREQRNDRKNKKQEDSDSSSGVDDSDDKQIMKE